MIKELSILLPVYNTDCYRFVMELKKQADGIAFLHYEIIVAEDGSNDKLSLESNFALIAQANCIYIKRTINIGRSAIRNYLAKRAKYNWVLFVDAGLDVVDKNFIIRYVSLDPSPLYVYYGGCTVPQPNDRLLKNLRYCYERQFNNKQKSSLKRSVNMHFRSCNFLCAKNILEKNPFDENFKNYGYEDVLWGKSLFQSGIHVKFINNMLIYKEFETNNQFLSKAHEALHTLCMFHEALKGYSCLLSLYLLFKKLNLSFLLRLEFKLFGAWQYKKLLSEKPSISLFQLYRIGYFSILMNNLNK